MEIKKSLLMAIEIFLIISIIPFLFILGTLEGDSVYLSLMVMLLAVVLLFYAEYKKFKVVLKRKEFIVAFIRLEYHLFLS